MTSDPIRQVTQILQRVESGDKLAAEQLLPKVYDQLRAAARKRLRNIQPGQTLQPTALVHEAWFKVAGSEDPGWNSQAHFYKAAAQAMRNILVDVARRKSAVRHGGEHNRADVDVDATVDAGSAGGGDTDVLALDEALTKLEKVDEEQARIVSLRFFGGLSMEEIAQTLSTSLSTVERQWRAARTVLREKLRPDG